MHFHSMVRDLLELPRDRSRRCVGLPGQQGSARQPRRHDRVVDLIVGELARPVPVQVQGADADPVDEQRESERGTNARLQGTSAELGPLNDFLVGEVVVKGGRPGAIGGDARAFAQRVLHLLHGRGDLIGHADAAQRPFPGYQHESRARNVQDISAGKAQGARRVVVLGARGDDLCEPLRPESTDQGTSRDISASANDGRGVTGVSSSSPMPEDDVVRGLYRRALREDGRRWQPMS